MGMEITKAPAAHLSGKAKTGDVQTADNSSSFGDILTLLLATVGFVLFLALLARMSNGRRSKPALFAPMPDGGAQYVTEDRLQQEISGVKSWARQLLSKSLKRLKDWVAAYIDTPTPNLIGGRGRKQTIVCTVQFERAVLYQIVNEGSAHNACKKSFVKVANGYKSDRALYAYWCTHKPEVQTVRESLRLDITRARLTPARYYEEFNARNAAKLQAI